MALFNRSKPSIPQLEECFSRALQAYQTKRLKSGTLSISFRFSLAVPDDAYSIAGLELFSASYEKRSDPLDLALDDFADIWEERIKKRRFTVILALDEIGAIAGFLALKGEVKKGFIGALYVHPRWFRQGAGTQLMHLCEEFVRECGGKELELHVQPLNNGAIAFYESLSFQKQGVKSSHLIVFKKEL